MHVADECPPACCYVVDQVHAKGKTIGKDVDFDKIARRTPGFTGELAACAAVGEGVAVAAGPRLDGAAA